MKATAANLEVNSKVALLAVKGMESYLVNGSVQKRHTEGQLFDTIAENFAKMDLQIKAVWTFTVDKIYDESANPETAGKQLF